MSEELIKRLRAKVEVGSSLLDGLPVNPDGAEAADHIEALTAALKAWSDKTEWVQQTSQPHELGWHRADVLRDRIAALIAAGDKLAGFDQHDEFCGVNAYAPKPCDCGYTEAWKQWQEARGE